MLSLSRPDLLLQDAYVNGEWLARDSRFQVLNPSTGAVLAARS